MLEETRRTYLKAAAIIPNWQTMNKNDLINECIDHENDKHLYNAYFSAVVLRYWSNIGKYYSDSRASGFSIEDCYEWLLDAITYILRKRKWRDPENPLSKDKCAPDKCINRCIYSARRQYYYTANLDKHKVNYGTVSLDSLNEEVGDHNELLSDDYIGSNTLKERLDLTSLFKDYFKKNKIVTTIVLYSLCTGDCFAQKTNTKEIQGKKVKQYSTEFKLSKLINCIYNCTESNIEDMARNLSLDKLETIKLHESFDSLKNITKNRVTTIVKKTMESLAGDSSLREYLCY